MTYIYKKSFGKYDSSTNFEGDVLTIEYVHSSVSEDIKVSQSRSVCHVCPQFVHQLIPSRLRHPC